MPGWFLSVWRPLMPRRRHPDRLQRPPSPSTRCSFLSLTLAAVSTACWHSQHDDGDNSLKVAP